ncbi:MAG TPA: tripartite tricarboxylate transporter substrate binding protein [Falsiroseomonas sp.]|jgi:tripartite-type tricarboxylate transporter receptor subunit TctC|nr:tripartite tricarboxylate transporter substrate binding protein [Falsiroseomonas sp.]
MNRFMTRRGLMAGTAALPFLARGAAAQAWSPTRPLRIVIGFPPGGGIDILARLMAPKISEKLGQPVVVENRPGANGLIATQGVAQSDPDGSTILFGTTGNLAVNPVLYADRVNLARDFAPLSLVASLPFVLVVNPSVQANTLADFIALARSKPGELNFGSSGNGGLPHLSGELLNARANIRTVHVPYRGSSPAYADLIGGRVQFMFDAFAIGRPHIEAGRVRALASTGPQRMAALPNVPTAKETLADFEVVNWYGMMVRAGTPQPAIQRLQQEVAAALRQPDVAERAASLGLDPVGSTAAAFAEFQRAEIAKWGSVIQSAGIKAE